MRLIRIEKVKTGCFVKDWNFKQWFLTYLTDGRVRCDEIKADFDSVEMFVEQMYGRSQITRWDGAIHINYFINTPDFQ